MPMIKPVSELRNYPEVLSNVEAAAQLNLELMRGRVSGEKSGWISREQMRKHFSERVPKRQKTAFAAHGKPRKRLDLVIPYSVPFRVGSQSRFRVAGVDALPQAAERRASDAPRFRGRAPAL